MNKRSLMLLLVAALMLVVFSGCNRALSTPPVPATQDTGLNPLTPGADIMMFATQTAIASGAQPKSVETATPIVSEADAALTVVPAESAPSQAQESKPAALPMPTPGRPESYTLQKGEWPICIARRFDVELGAFFSANGLSMASKPGVGTVLKIPQSGSWSTANGPRALRAHTGSHTVQAGETVYSIACSYGDVNPDAIIALNGLQSPYELTSGQVLSLP